jgi:choline dehydrogenase-like flavoprotein
VYDVSIQSARELGKRSEITADVVIVGSGAGGAVIAAELAEAGQEVVILEEGPYLSPEAHAKMRPSESIRHLWRDGAMTVTVPRGNSPFINVTMGRGVGGSSVLTGGVCFRTPEHVLHEWSDKLGLSELTPEGMAPYFEEVEATVHVEEVPVEMRSRGTQLFGEGARKMGYELETIRRNTRGCDGCGQCNFGCPHGAKLSVDRTYLPRAMTAGAELYADCMVERILIENGRAVGVLASVLDERRKRVGRLTIRARRVVVCAGSFHGPLLLKKSRVGRQSGQVGRNLTVHPAFRMIARFDEPIHGWRGSLQAAYSTAFGKELITLVGIWIPPSVIAATMPGFGVEHTRRAADMPHLAMFGGLIHDEGGGIVRRGPGREPIVTYRMAKKDRAAVPRLIRLMADTFLAAGAQEVFLPILGSRPVDADQLRSLDLERIKGRNLECSSQHPLGTCRMGSDARSSVVDPEGRAWDVEELYVGDGSVVPTSLGVNPQLTIMAMALRIVRKMLQRPLPAP